MKLLCITHIAAVWRWRESKTSLKLISKKPSQFQVRMLHMCNFCQDFNALLQAANLSLNLYIRTNFMKTTAKKWRLLLSMMKFRSICQQKKHNTLTYMLVHHILNQIRTFDWSYLKDWQLGPGPRYSKHDTYSLWIY